LACPRSPIDLLRPRSLGCTRTQAVGSVLAREDPASAGMHESPKGVSVAQHNARMTEISTVEFADGWTVRLRSLYCRATYAGHLEGAHTQRTNDHLIAATINRAIALFGNTPVYVIPPMRTTGRIIDGYSDEGEPARRETLPPICCIGDFEADAVPVADGCASGLIVIWFQSAPPPVPLEAALVNMLGDIRWDDHAASYWY
jgi:hypothetical protein